MMTEIISVEMEQQNIHVCFSLHTYVFLFRHPRRPRGGSRQRAAALMYSPCLSRARSRNTRRYSAHSSVIWLIFLKSLLNLKLVQYINSFIINGFPKILYIQSYTFVSTTQKKVVLTSIKLINKIMSVIKVEGMLDIHPCSCVWKS